MDLDPIGKHCTLQSCNVLDLLPIRCSCLKWFCKLHISPDLHDCSSLQQHPSEPSPPTQTLPRCDLSGCGKPPLASGAVPAGCPGCQLRFCVDHRHMQSHSCAGLTIEKGHRKHEASRAILAQGLPATGSSISHTPAVARRYKSLPSDSPQLAQLKRVNLMKLRHKATPGDPKDRSSMLSVEQRLHVTVRLKITGQSAKEAILWFPKTMITGRALDLIARHFGGSNTAPTLHLEQLSTELGSRVLQNHLELSEHLEDGLTIVLTDSQSTG